MVRISARRSSVLLAALALGAASSSVVADNHLTFTAIGSLPGTNASWAYGVSGDGSTVVGRSGTNFYYGNSGHGYRWNRSSGMEDLTPLDADGTAYGVSNDGSIVVGTRRTGSGNAHALLWTSAGGSNGGNLGAEFFGVSADGAAACGYEVDSHSVARHATAWNESDRLQMIDEGVPATSQSLAISANGLVVVGQASWNGIGNRAFRWTATDGFQNIGATTALGPTTSALGVSSNGSVVVGSSFEVGVGNHAFRWTAETGMQDLGVLAGPGFTTSIAYSVSPNGQTIVGVSSDGTVANNHAFIWRQDTGMQDLNIVLAGLIPAGWTLVDARGASTDGTVIVGTARNPAGEPQAWIADVPVLAAPTIVRQPGTLTNPPLTGFSVSVEAVGFGDLSFQWRHNSIDIPGATNGLFEISSPIASDARSYDCVVTNSCGSTTSTAVTLTVCVADFNRDGSVSSQDFFDFITAFFGPGADINNDGLTTSQDFFDFVTALFAGC